MRVLILFLAVTSSIFGLDHTQHAQTLENHIRVAMSRVEIKGTGLALWDEVEEVLAIKGPHPKGGCGGIDYNRLFLKMKRPVVEIIGDYTSVPALKPSGDGGGPHDGFDASFESHTKRPRLQGHYRVTAPDESELQLLRQRVGIIEVEWETLLEVDLDYNWLHGSNPLCSYKGILTSFLPGLFRGRSAEELFRTSWMESSVIERVR